MRHRRAFTFVETPVRPPALVARNRRAFTLVELLAVIGIIAILMSILVPVVTRVRQAAVQTECASNLRQIGIGLTRYFNDFHDVPTRIMDSDPYEDHTQNFFTTSNPHVFKYGAITDSCADVMERYIGSKKVFYCPGNSIGRDVDHWWPNPDSGTIASTYQFPFLLHPIMWVVPHPDYRRLTTDRVLATDYLGCILRVTGDVHIVAWNHERSLDGSPRGMNVLYGDGHVNWHKTQDGWELWGVGNAFVYWFWAKPS